MSQIFPHCYVLVEANYHKKLESLYNNGAIIEYCKYWILSENLHYATISQYISININHLTTTTKKRMINQKIIEDSISHKIYTGIMEHLHRLKWDVIF